MKYTNYSNNEIVHIISGLENGGAESILYNVVSIDKKFSHKVISMTGKGFYGENLEQSNILLDCPKFNSLMNGLAGCLKIIKNLRAIKPKLVVCWMYHPCILAGLISRLMGIPVIWSIHHANVDYKSNGFITAVIIRICSLLSHIIPTRIVYCSNYSMQSHLQIGFSKYKSIVIHNGVRTEFFSPIDPDIQAAKRFELFNLPPDVTILAFIARYTVEKDFPNFLEAINKLASAKYNFLVLMAGGNIDHLNEELSILIEKYKLGDKIKLIGSRRDINTIMAIANLLIVSSSYESFGNVAAEAMSTGTPVIGTNTGAIADIVGQTGWVVPACNATMLSDAIAVAIDTMRLDLDGWSLRQIDCRKRIMKYYSFDKMLEDLHKCWQLDEKLTCEVNKP